MTDENVRGIALSALLQITEEGSFSGQVLQNALLKYAWKEKSDRALLTRLIYGTLDWLIQIDWIIDSFSKIKVSKMKPVIRAILRLSVYQLLYMDRIPDRAVCNEAVELTKKRHMDGLKGFVNGVLRNISREKNNIVFPNDSITYSIPSWIIDMWDKQLGHEKTENICRSFLEKKDMTFRLNNSVMSENRCEDLLNGQSIDFKKDPVFKGIYHLKSFDHFYDIKAVNMGGLMVQDISSYMSVLACGIKESQNIIDVCAAPGGKSLCAADIMNGNGYVLSLDISEAKKTLIDENIKKCGFKNIETAVNDALEYKEKYSESFDLVIADLPCSGLGVIGKKPDIKLHASAESLKQMSILQKQILETVCRYVKKGGKLLFSTCTINKSENEDNYRYFLDNHSEFHTVNLDFMEEMIKSCQIKDSADTLKDGYIQLLPGLYSCDGFFFALFQKN